MKTTSDDKKKSVAVKKKSLENLLKRSTIIKDEVEHSAEELASINTTLKKDKKGCVSLKEIQAAIKQNEDVEHDVDKSAHDLNEVNTELVDEMDERIGIESELEKSKADLIAVRKELRESQGHTTEARNMSLKDKLTGIPNRASFEQSLEQGLAEAKRHDWKLAVLFIDVNKFKQINDTYGHDQGDYALQLVAKRLQSSIRDEDSACRWGGDEFICLMLEVKKESDVKNFAQKLVSQIAEACEFNGVTLSVQTSIGIALFPQDGETTDRLIKNADVAMFKAKLAKKGVSLFSEA